MPGWMLCFCCWVLRSFYSSIFSLRLAMYGWFWMRSLCLVLSCLGPLFIQFLSYLFWPVRP
ncbi:hypothetical protein I7I53_09748 [Histoplasma capsulatum var. duboisii H88]|uniref:Uncharacterized protein n=1 Tax=Ajellomyces capsulatus (strain H88) TaxID=544711 RepID=A0A8A1L5M9_AJEC8|nr:hypothetical protein I7I53_09748 [Histoplasma capsulatum var. duboisii H88]